MGLLSRLLGNASEADVGDVEEYLGKILADGETVQRAFALVRDLFIFTDRRFIMVDKQGMTGMKTEYHSIPYRAITHFAVETAGPTDLDSELRIWVSSSHAPIQKTFRRGSAIFELGDISLGVGKKIAGRPSLRQKML